MVVIERQHKQIFFCAYKLEAFLAIGHSFYYTILLVGEWLLVGWKVFHLFCFAILLFSVCFFFVFVYFLASTCIDPSGQTTEIDRQGIPSRKYVQFRSIPGPAEYEVGVHLDALLDYN